MKKNFEHCLGLLLKHEGGFVNHPKDPGGMTNLGITKAVYEAWVKRPVTEQEMRELKPENVLPIYKAQYWDKIRADELPSGVDWMCFDWAVNSGVSRVARALQKEVGAPQDGVIGPKTIQLASKTPAKLLIEDLYDQRQAFYESLKTFETFGRGWTRRNVETLQQALLLAEEGTSPSP
jgi:lysozyme family protein